MPINASYEFIEAEKKYLQAGSNQERIACLEDMIRKAPAHKGAENLRAELRLRLKKLKEKLDKSKKAGRGKKGIRKEGFQCVLVGRTNSGKSMLLSKFTNARPFVSDVEFSTGEPELGTMDYEGVRAQVVDLPSLGAKDFDYNIANTADCLIIVADKFEDFDELKNSLGKSYGKEIYVLNKVDLLSAQERRKIEARCKSKRLNYVLVSARSGEGVNELKRKVFDEMGVIRVYTKEPGKPASKEPIVLKSGASVKDVAEKILKGLSSQIKETRLTGPSAKFLNQKVGMSHVLKDRDVIEFHSR